MATRKRSLKTKINTKLMIDVIAASLLVQKSPLLVDMIYPLSGQMRAVAGVAVGYLTGAFLKRPDLANASIALGVVDFVSPFVDQLFGGVSQIPAGVVSLPGGANPPMPMPMVDASASLASYVNLNDYVYNPTKRLNYNQYQTSYGY